MKTFKDKVCVITGAASGMGQAVSILLAEKGAKLIITDVNKRKLDETKISIKKLGGVCEAHIVNSADRDATFSLAAHIDSKYGGTDFVLNNAGVAQIAHVSELTIDDFNYVMDIDFWGVVHGTQAFLPQMERRNSGHIANTSSIFGLVGVPSQAAYNSAKFAVLGFTEALRFDLADTNINVSCIHPGGVLTNIVRNARLTQGPGQDQRHTDAVANFDRVVRKTPEIAAKIILKGIRKNKARILVGYDAIYVDIIKRLFPTHYLKFLPFGSGLDDPKNTNTQKRAQQKI